MLAIGLLSLLGFSSCSPRLRARRAAGEPVDTLKVRMPDTIIVRPNPDPPVKLMYGVPPARYMKMNVTEKDLKTE